MVDLRARLASGNPNKLVELRSALPQWRIELCAPRVDPPAETGATFLENALLKARFGREHTPPDAWALGEDSGIEAAALGGRPGIESARWADDGVARLLAELDHYEGTAEPGNAFRRVPVKVRLERGGTVDAWSYEMGDSQARRRPIETR